MVHDPVLVAEVLDLLTPKGGEVAIDGTLGLGGHTRFLAQKVEQDGKVLAFDQDERNLIEARKRLLEFKNIIFIHDNFRYLKKRITEQKIDGVDLALFDLGLSSPHIDEPERGFSFMRDGPLDMRFDLRQSLRAKDIVNIYKEEDLRRLFYLYAEEKMAPKIAKKICERRKVAPFETTAQFRDFLEKFLPKFGKTHPATKIFQALRIEVNQELIVLREALEQIVEILRVGGRVAFISYHSLEDRLVKKFFRDLERPSALPEEQIYRLHGDPVFESLTRKPIVPSAEEIAKNPRSRSAKLRVYKKLRAL